MRMRAGTTAECELSIYIIQSLQNQLYKFNRAYDLGLHMNYLYDRTICCYRLASRQKKNQEPQSAGSRVQTLETHKRFMGHNTDYNSEAATT